MTITGDVWSWSRTWAGGGGVRGKEKAIKDITKTISKLYIWTLE